MIKPGNGGFAAVRLDSIRIRGFRGIGDCSVSFEPDLTLLVGRNNAGKSRILRAIAIALGSTPPVQDDLTVDGEEEVLLDIVVAPARDGAERFGDAEAQRLGPAVQPTQDDPPLDRFAWRTTLRRSQEGDSVRSEVSLLIYNQTIAAWEPSPSAAIPTVHQRSIIAGDLIDARRDLVEELARRGSRARRVFDDLEIPESDRAGIETDLQQLSAAISEKSLTLNAVVVSLKRLSDSVGSIGHPSVSAVPLRVNELARTISVDLKTAGDQSLPVRFHGAGSRSLASLRVQGVLYERRLGADGPMLRPHPISLIEEPEAHLHPQAQHDLHKLLADLPGQVIATTHSSHLVSSVPPTAIRLVQPSRTSPKVVDFHPTDSDAPQRGRRPNFHVAEMEKLKRTIERPFGELLFASSVVIGDGATERALLAPLLRQCLGDAGHGVCVIDPGSLRNESALHAVKFAEFVGIPWVLFADSDSDGRKDADHIVNAMAADYSKRVVWSGASAKSAEREGASEAMLIHFDAELCTEACRSLGYEPTTNDELLRFMKGRKGVIGSLIAGSILDRYPCTPEGPPLTWPAPILELVALLTSHLSVSDPST